MIIVVSLYAMVVSKPTSTNTEMELKSEDVKSLLNTESAIGVPEVASIVPTTEKIQDNVEAALTPESGGKIMKPESSKQFKSVENVDGMDGAENSIVFRPFFRSKSSALPAKTNYGN